MTLTQIIDALAQEALLLDPGNLQACGKMLSLLESLNHPVVKEKKAQLKEYLEAIIMNDLDGQAPDIETVINTVEELQNLIRKELTSFDEADQEFQQSMENTENHTSEDSIPESEFTETEEEQELYAENESDETEDSVDDEPVETENEESQADSESDEPDEEGIDDPELMSDFITEAYEHLNSIELNMVEWEKSPNDSEIINSIFRPFHTIKGVAGFLNLQKVNHLAHQLENLLDEAREGKIHLSPELSDLIFDGVDILKSMIGTLQKALENNGPIKYGINFESFVQRLSRFLSAAEYAPSDDEPIEVNSGKKEPIGEILVQNGKLDKTVLGKTLEKQADSGSQKKIGEMLVEDKVVSARDVRDAVRKQSESTRQNVEKYLKVDTSKMDQLLDMVGELVISQTMVTQNPEVLRISDQRLTRDISQLKRVTTTLQNISMSMRLVPVGATFQKMNRIVRDLARKSGKKINLVLEGQSAEIDRNMVEELYDPLVHMVRNSCDHGIKSPEERIKYGKSPEGTVTLKAEHSGGKVVISIADDGEGLDRDMILLKAREKGLLGQDEKMEEREIFNLIFMPGFSTAKQVTDVSGRGVGMDVVRKAIEKLRGSVEITSEKGVGTTFTIKLPLTTAIIDGMLVQLGAERFIIPTLSVRQLVRPDQKDVNKIVGKGETVMVRGNLMPLIRLGNLLNIDNAIEDLSKSVIIIVEDGDEVAALQVDSLLGKQEVVIKTLGENFKSMKGVAGGAILGDGKVGLILDVRSIINTENASLEIA
ncbi:MAG: chemotaxis protein CheA [Candidatus Latescibacteria bacterium]|nr:chemotaxis protein CheA [Candidatus Latescibacterota bacterium]